MCSKGNAFPCLCWWFVVHWGKFEKRVAGGERWIFNFAFCVLSASSPTTPSSLGARRGFTWGVWRISGVLQDVCLITCARDAGTRRIHLALIIEFFGKNTKCSLESENKMMACTIFFDTVCYFVIAVIPGWKLWVNREPQKYRQTPVCKKKRRKAEVRGAAFVLCLNFR